MGGKGMKAKHITGKSVEIKQPAHLLFGAFSDLRNFVARLPEDKKEGITVTEDTIEGSIKGITLGAAVAQRLPFSLIRITDYSADGSKPIFPFEVTIHFNAKDEQTTEFHIELDAGLSGIMKIMIGGKLQDAVDRITEQIAMAAEGRLA